MLLRTKTTLKDRSGRTLAETTQGTFMRRLKVCVVVSAAVVVMFVFVIIVAVVDIVAVLRVGIFNLMLRLVSFHLWFHVTQ